MVLAVPLHARMSLLPCVSVLPLLAAMLHVLMSVCLRMPAYYSRMFEPTTFAEALPAASNVIAQHGRPCILACGSFPVGHIQSQIMN